MFFAAKTKSHKRLNKAICRTFNMVEPRGIEPLSENPSSQLSPSAVCRLKFPHTDADKQASAIGSL